MIDRLVKYWVYGGSLAGLLLLLLLPAINTGWSLALVLVYLQMPIYMLHQLEEHDADRFQHVVNHLIGHDRNVLPSGAIFVINIGVWLLNLISFTLGARLGIGWGLIGVYAMVINAIVHIGQGVRMRHYNPGLVTAVVLFLPVGLGGLWAISATGAATMLQHLVGIAVGLGIHAAIIVYVLGNARRLGLAMGR
ncbi:MAG TPA: HXXEE domain-containing protein [Devosia sp.]|nr:HXXEE domain-containing protein [Devosia sp.]